MDVEDIHSRKSQSARTKTSERFAKATQGILFTSDVSARGLDYPNVTFVLKVGAPSSKEQYVHRTGRSARAGKSGVGLLLLCDWERFFLKDIRSLPVKPWTGAAVRTDVAPGLARAMQVSKTKRAAMWPLPATVSVGFDSTHASH
jgi:ATP-dependent RNA helicase MSS116